MTGNKAGEGACYFKDKVTEDMEAPFSVTRSVTVLWEVPVGST